MSRVSHDYEQYLILNFIDCEQFVYLILFFNACKAPKSHEIMDANRKNIKSTLNQISLFSTELIEILYLARSVIGTT